MKSSKKKIWAWWYTQTLPTWSNRNSISNSEIIDIISNLTTETNSDWFQIDTSCTDRNDFAPHNDHDPWD